MEVSCCNSCNQGFLVGYGFLEDGCAQYCSSKCWLEYLKKLTKEKLEKFGFDFINEWLEGYPKDSQLLLLLEIRVENLEDRLGLLSQINEIKIIKINRFYKENQLNPDLINSEEFYSPEACPDCLEQRNVQYQLDRNALVYGKCNCNTISSMFSSAYVVYQQNDIKNSLDMIQNKIEQIGSFKLDEYNLEGTIKVHEARWLKGGSGEIKLVDGQTIKFYRENKDIYYCTNDKVLEAKLFLYLTKTINVLLDLQIEQHDLINSLNSRDINELTPNK